MVVDDRLPRPHTGAVALRMPGGGKPEGRAASKELGVFEGANCYFCVGDLDPSHPEARIAVEAAGRAADRAATSPTSSSSSSSSSAAATASAASANGTLGGGFGGNGGGASALRRKFLVYDGIVASNALPVYHRFPMTVATLSQLVGLAFATDRILVLPAILQMQKWMHAWEVLDPTLLNRLISWRPATFFDHLDARNTARSWSGGGSQRRRGRGAGGGGGGEAWNASGVTGAQAFLRGKLGIGVRRLTDAPPNAQGPATW